MSQPAYSMLKQPVSYEPRRLAEIIPLARGPGIRGDTDDTDDTEADPYRFGWRDCWETLPDGSQQLREIPLTYGDTLDPQLGDHVSEDSLHDTLVRNLTGTLIQRYKDDPMVVVWSSLKVLLPKRGSGQAAVDKDSPEGAQGPAPDICVMTGVRDPERRRTSFRLGEEPGEILLAIEVVSESSAEKDYTGILPKYARLKVREYVAIEPEGIYIDGPFKVKGWRYDEATMEMSPTGKARMNSRTTGVIFSPGPGGNGLEIRDAASGELLPPLEQALQKAEQERQKAEQRAEQEAAERQKAEAELEREAKVRFQAEERLREVLAENERLRAAGTRD